jgi:hypothetical protein
VGLIIYKYINFSAFVAGEEIGANHQFVLSIKLAPSQKKGNYGKGKFHTFKGFE